MRMLTAIMIATLIIATPAYPGAAYSPIGNVTSWDKDRLSKAGIVVRPWRHDLQGEDPPLDWVQVTFDCTAVPKDQPVVMTAWFRAKDGKTITASRTERASAVDGKISLVFCITPEQSEASGLDIYIWTKTSDGSAAHGYQLSLKRIAELARAERAGAPTKSEK